MLAIHSGWRRRDKVVTMWQGQRGAGGGDGEVGWALGCAFAVALVVMLGLVVYLWVL